jgi:hypothetical protein
MSDRFAEKRSGADASDTESLPILVGRLGKDLTELVDSKLSLLKMELQEDVRSYGRSGARVIGGAVVAAVGVGLLSAGAAFFVSTLLRKTTEVSLSAAYSVGFASVGLLFLVVGALVAVRAAQKLATSERKVPQATEASERSQVSLRPGSA